jgi:hypothetical protein
MEVPNASVNNNEVNASRLALIMHNVLHLQDKERNKLVADLSCQTLLWHYAGKVGTMFSFNDNAEAEFCQQALQNIGFTTYLRYDMMVTRVHEVAHKLYVTIQLFYNWVQSVFEEHYARLVYN